MKICMLGNAQSPHIRGWATFFHSRAHEVTILSARPAVIPGVAVHTPKLPLDGLLRRNKIYDEDRTPNLAVYVSYVLLALTVRRVVRRLAPDIVMATTLETNGVLSLILRRHPTALYHLGCKALSVASETSLAMRVLVKTMIRFADMLYTGDSAGVARLEALGAAREKIFVNPWGVDLEQFSPARRSEELRERMGGADKMLFVCVRVLLPDYHVQGFISAIPLIVAEHPDAHFAIVGDGPERSRLRALVDELAVGEFVTFIGHVPFPELPGYMASADIYVDPVNWQVPEGRTWWGHRMQCSMDGTGYSITLLMCLACGRVPLVTNRAGLTDIFDEDLAPLLLWQPGHPKDLAAKANYLLSRPEERERLQQVMLDLARDRFDWQRNAREVEQDYIEQLAGSRLASDGGRNGPV